MIIRKYLFSHGFRYRLHVKSLPGNPDIVLPKFRTVIFVNGCFWHGHNCKWFVVPKTRTDFWITKINQNKKRDKKAIKMLRADKWNIIVVFECQLRQVIQNRTLNRLIRSLSQIISSTGS